LRRDWGQPMATLEGRIAKLESASPEGCPAFETSVRCLPPLDDNDNLNWNAVYPQFSETFGPWLSDLGNKSQRLSGLKA
jgi:hypothetical protein